MNNDLGKQRGKAAPLRGPGRFQWHTGAWFGGQLGASSYLGILGCVFWSQGNVLAGFLILCCFFAANFIGWRLWAKRTRIKPFMAVQVLLLSLFSFSLLSFVFIELFLKRVSLHKTDFSAANYLVLLTFPVLMLLFWLVERGAGRANK